MGSQTEECRVLLEVWQKVVLRSPDNLVNSYEEGLEKVLRGKSLTNSIQVV